MLLVGLVLALVMIESKVEQLGLFKALGEQNSLEGFHIAQGDLFWVSLMLVIPTVACYVVLGFREGERLANLGRSGMKCDKRFDSRAPIPLPAHSTSRSSICGSKMPPLKLRLRPIELGFALNSRLKKRSVSRTWRWTRPWPAGKLKIRCLTLLVIRNRPSPGNCGMVF